MVYETRDIGVGATVSSSTLYFHADVSADDNGGEIAIVEGQQAATNTIATTDFDDCGDAIDDPTEGSDRFDITGRSANNWYTFKLNATGRGWIDDGSGDGWTTLGMRISFDMEDDNSELGTGENDYHLFDTSETSLQEPYIEIEYTEAASNSCASRS